MGAWIQWLFCIFLSFLLMLFLDSMAGGFLLCFFLLAGILPCALVLLFRKNLKIELSADRAAAEQGEEVCLTFTVKRTDEAKILKLFPVPFLIVEVESDGGFCEETPLSFTLLPGWKREASVTETVRGAFAGKGKILIQSAKLSDFLGLLRMRIPEGKLQRETAISVFPVLYELEQGLPLLLALQSESLFSDSEEFSEEGRSGSGFPGYENREYEPGDSIKRINWKLSARKEELWVRKDEFAARKKQTLILDPACETETSVASAASRGLLLEGLLALGAELLKEGIPLRLAVFSDGIWETTELSSAEEIGKFKGILAGAEFLKTEESPLSPEETAGTVVFTLSSSHGEKVREQALAVVYGGEEETPAWRIFRLEDSLTLKPGGSTE